MQKISPKKIFQNKEPFLKRLSGHYKHMNSQKVWNIKHQVLCLNEKPLCFSAGVFCFCSVGWMQSDLLYDVRTELALQLVIFWITNRGCCWVKASKLLCIDFVHCTISTNKIQIVIFSMFTC